MKISDFLKRHASALVDFQNLLSDKPPAGPAALNHVDCRATMTDCAIDDTYAQKPKNAPDNSSNAPPTTKIEKAPKGGMRFIARSNQQDSSTPICYEAECPEPQLQTFYFHVMSKCHVDAYILQRPEARKIFEAECLHYGRVCEIAITNYCIMDNHFHLNVGVPACSVDEAREKIAKMMGSIKQQFTRKFKIWYNTVYRKTIRYRKPKLGNGSMWAGPIRAEFIKDELQLAASTLYTEANRIKVSCAEQIARLTEPPTLTNNQRSKNFGIQSEYNLLLEFLYENSSQSARFYLASPTVHVDTALTDGLDANWASEQEVKKYWRVPAHSLPDSWRKVHYDNQRRILKPTSVRDRTYHTTPFIECLGKTPATRRRNFARLVLGICWKNRSQITAITNSSDQQAQSPSITW